jgi:glycosyltransferase involved in cell wall biosynthesis
MVEAMLLARPCLVTDVGGCADWISDGVEGFLAPSSIAGLTAALDRAWTSRPRWPELASAARTCAERLHDPEPGLTLLAIIEGSTGRS